MSRGGLKPETIIRKQAERAELARDATRLKCCGATFREIAKKLDCSLTQAHRLIHEGIDSYLKEAKQELKEWLDTIVAEHIKVAQEAWIQWERSKQDRQRITSKTTQSGIEVTTIIESHCGDPRHLSVVQSSMDSIAKLQKLFVEEGTKASQPANTADVSEQVASMFASMLPPSVVREYIPAKITGPVEESVKINGNE